MRFLLEISVVVLVVVAGWRQPFRDHLSSLFPQLGIQPSRSAQLAQMPPPERGNVLHWGNGHVPSQVGEPPRDNSWMWERSKLDRNPRSK